MRLNPDDLNIANIRIKLMSAMREVSAAFTQQLAERYRLERGIGEGGMASVYLARDERHNRPVVVKMMRQDLVSGDAARRFVREVQITAKLHHPNVLSLIDSGTADDTSYYVVPYVGGGSLRERIARDGALPLDVVLQVVNDVAGALDYAHAQGVVHRDIKPENILLEGDRAIVADFGIAHAVDEAIGERLTATGLALGTPAYMSPEQTDASRVDGRSDFYSLGCVLYEMLTGHAPYTGSTPQEILARHAVDPVPPLRSARPGMPSAVEHVVATALAKSPADRYQSGRTLVQALDAAIHSTEAEPRLKRLQRRWRVTTLTVALVSVASLLFWRSFGHPAFASRDWIVVADLVGDGADSALDQTMRDALTLTLQQSRYVNVEPSSAIAATLRMMSKADSTRLTASVAREVAIREGARAVLVPSVVRLDSTYVFTSRILAPQSGADIVTVQERSAGRGHVLEALDRLAVDIRKRLGEPLSAAEPAMALDRATTPSLEALRAWTVGNRQFVDGRYAVAAAEYQRAVALDSNFAMAHTALGATFYWTNQRDSGEKHFQRALALEDRLTNRERVLIKADVAKWRQQTDEAVSLYQQLLAQYPDDLGARYDLGFVALRESRWAQALEQYEWLKDHDSTDAGVRINLATCLGQLHRIPEALVQYRAGFALRPQWARSSANIVLEYGQAMVWAGRPASAESLFRGQLEGDASARARAHRSLALLNFSLGKAAAAREFLRQAIVEDVGSSSATSMLRDRMYLTRALLAAGKLDSARATLHDAEEFARKPNLDPPWIGSLGELAARAGDGVAAKGMETRMLSLVQPGNSDDAVTQHSLQGVIALLVDKNPAAARKHLDAALAARRDPIPLGNAALAALAQGRRPDAEALFAEVLTEGPFLNEALETFLDAHLELAHLAIARGDTAAARLHLGWLTTQLARGDSDFVLRREAQSVLTSINRK